MGATQFACAAIVALYVVLRLRARGADRRAVALRLFALACAAWAGEDSVIRAYGFYSYAPGWFLFLDRVPILIVAIWPIVIDSAHVLARALVGSAPSKVAAMGGLIVLADASLIEPIAVHAGLWTWSAENARSFFDVPPIGILGWAFFAAAAIATFEVRERRVASPFADFAVLVVAPLAAHAALGVAWWCAFRWMGGGVSPWALAGAAWCAAVPLAVAAWQRGRGVPLRAVLARAPGAAFFFALLAASAGGRGDLAVYALAFAPPYLALAIRKGA
jgi:hypothetical protein